MTEPVLAAEAAGGHPEREEHRVRSALALAPFLLLLLSLAFTVMAGGRPVADGRLTWIIGVTVLACVLRGLWLWRLTDPRTRIVAFVINLALTVVLISFSPLYGVYAFVGYLDAVAIFTGVSQVSALIAVGSLNALAQSGGPEGAYRQPLVFAFLLLANGGLAVGMVHIDRRRQRTVTRLEQALGDLAEAGRVNELLHQQVVEQARAAGVLEERQRLSREIHDTVAQGLIALLRQIEIATEASTDEAVRAHLARADATARDGLAEARRAVQALASPRLDGADLPRALQALVTDWSLGSGIGAGFRVHGEPATTAHDADLLRVCQEGLANVGRHARATRVDVVLSYSQQRVELDLRDDGIGFDPTGRPTGHGLRGMRGRLLAAGGELSLDTTEGEGCTLRVAIPV